jgi:hypothetical protein
MSQTTRGDLLGSPYRPEAAAAGQKYVIAAAAAVAIVAASAKVLSSGLLVDAPPRIVKARVMCLIRACGVASSSDGPFDVRDKRLAPGLDLASALCIFEGRPTRPIGAAGR